jgi:uncharacterized protein
MYIDTSCLAAFYLPEKKSSVVQNKIREADRVHISYLTEIELLSAIRKRVRMGDLSNRDGNKTYGLFKEHRKAGLFEIAELSPTVYKASGWILDTTAHGLRTLDAIHLGASFEYKLKLFTFDKLMQKAAQEFKIGLIK